MTLPAWPGPRDPRQACAPGCAAATVLLGIPGLLVTAGLTRTPDGRSLVEVITDPAAEAQRCCRGVRRGGHPGQGRPRPHPATCSSATSRSCWTGARSPGRCDTQAVSRNFHRWLPPWRIGPAEPPGSGSPGSARPSAMTLMRPPQRGAATASRTAPPPAPSPPTPMSSSLNLDQQQEPVEAAGVDQFRRSTPADRIGPGADKVARTRSEWLAHLVDLGSGGTLGLAEGPAAAAEKDLLAGHAAKLRLPGDGHVRHLPFRRPPPGLHHRRLSPGGTRKPEDRRRVSSGFGSATRTRTRNSACPARCTT